MLQPYRCQICGESYLGTAAPDRCPFCGAAAKHLLVAAEWYDHGKIAMGPLSRRYCATALQIELDNAGFYRACAARAQHQINAAIFKRLSKQEAEHAELIAEMCGEPLAAVPTQDCPELDADKFQAAHAREQRAIMLYLEIVREAPEPRMQEVFSALAEVEATHLQVSNIYR